uniref:helix-turn-helix domain-containing protein n=1 Tax=Phocaeicola vulgatus TaxID=821 RepID=UPI004028ED2B
MKKILKDFSRIYRLQDELLMGKTDFLTVKYRKGERLEMEIKNGIMSTILAGEISIMCNHLWIRESVKEGEMFLLLEKSFISIEILEDTEIFLMRSSSLSKQGETLVLDKLSKLTPQINYNLNSLPTCLQIMEIIRQIKSYNKSGIMNDSLAFIKRMELFYVLLSNYSEMELASLFYPLVSRFPKFRHFILCNYRNVKSAKELIQMSDMSKSLFYEKFMEEFHMSVKEWMLHKKVDMILLKAAKPDMTVKQLIIECDCCSFQQFNSFCKKYIGMSPRDLIKEKQGVMNLEAALLKSKSRKQDL